MKQIYVFILLLILVPFIQLHAVDNDDTFQIMQLAERRAQQVAALSKTGIFDLDHANSMHHASPFLLDDNCLRLVFAEPVLASIIKAVYENLSCVERIKSLGTLREYVKEITLKLNNDAYQKAVYYAKLSQPTHSNNLVNSARSYSALENTMVQKQQQQKSRLVRCLNWLCR